MRERGMRLAHAALGGRAGALKRWLVPVVELECRVAAAWARGAHERLRTVEYRLPPVPSSFDHRIDLYSRWQATRDAGWLERGVFTGLCLRGGKVLELACGDGFNTRHFYSLRSESIVACDVDADTIEKARTRNPGPNVEYLVVDLRRGLPEGRFDNVVWDFGFSFATAFTDDELRTILGEAHERLLAGGVLSGHTTTDPGSTDPEVRDRAAAERALERRLREHFGNVVIFTTTSPTRVNLYFWAADGPVPFDQDWPGRAGSSTRRDVPIPSR